jgi:glycine dehydrogenase subunit 1
MRELAELNLERAHTLQARLLEIPWISAAFEQPFFNEFTLQFDAAVSLERVGRAIERAGLIGGYPLREWYPELRQASLWCATERVPREAIDRLVDVLSHV